MAEIEGRGLRVVGEAEAGSEDLLGEHLFVGRQVFKRCGGSRDNRAGAGGLDRGQTRRRGGFRPELLTRTAVETVAVDTDEEAARLRFPGSPTIRVDGEDLFPASSAAEREDWRLGCRVYATPGGFKGSPTAAMIEDALKRKGAASARFYR
jgi:hypothetical protein